MDILLYKEGRGKFDNKKYNKESTLKISEVTL